MKYSHLCLLALILNSCFNDSNKPICGKTLPITERSIAFDHVFYTSDPIEKARDLLNPSQALHKYGAVWDASFKIKNTNSCDVKIHVLAGTFNIKIPLISQKFHIAPDSLILKAGKDTTLTQPIRISADQMPLEIWQALSNQKDIGYEHTVRYAVTPIGDLCKPSQWQNKSDTIGYEIDPTLNQAEQETLINAGLVGGNLAYQGGVSAAVWGVNNPDKIANAAETLIIIISILLKVAGH